MKKINIWISLFFLVTILDFSLFSQVNNNIDLKQITLEDIWQKYTFYPKGLPGLKSMNDGLYYTILDDNQIIQYSYQTGEKVRLIADGKKLTLKGDTNPVEIEDYEFSPDETQILITSDEEPIYRYSSISKNYIFNLVTGNITPIANGTKQQLATFSPDGKKLAYVRDNNLFIYDLITGAEEQITTDGEHNKIINGAPDWVYEEEFGFSKGFQWSPDGKCLAFYRFDESRVKEYTMLNYGKLYPEPISFKYPKAGEDNSVVTIHFFNLINKKTIAADIGQEIDQYIPRIKWTQSAAYLCITRLNRLQNNLELLLCDAATGKSRVIFTEINKYYVDINDDLTFLKDNKGFLWTSEQDGFNHIYHYGLDGKLIRQITKGSWDVVDFKGIDESKGLLYFTAAISTPWQKDLYSIRTDGTKMNKLSIDGGMNDASFNSNFQYYFLSYSNANKPKVITLKTAQGKTIKVIEDNQKINEKLNEYGIGKKEFISFKSAHNITLNGWIIKPPGFDPAKKYPVLMYVYGGPGGNTVFDRWEYMDMWHRMLAQKGYIVVSFDNRGTAYRGQEFKKCTYMQLGKYETIDQIDVAKYLSSLPYVDASRIGIWGWSYGGYLSLSCLFKGADYFKLAVAVAPVTNWRYYDNIYTERFMRTPQENPAGYDSNSPINFVNKFKGKLLVIHGSSDDNVHLQNTMELTQALQKANKQFDLMIYPNKNHSIYGGLTRLNLFQKITDYIDQNL
jgi:dipeptidyl-peptidase 4